MSESPFVSVEEVTSTPGPTYGLTARQLRFDVRKGYVPGTIDHRGRIVIRRTEWNRWLEGEETRRPVGITSIREKAS